MNNALEFKEKARNRVLIEMIIVMTATLALTFTASRNFKGLVSIIPLVYFFMEKFKRKRSWKEVGFNKKKMGKDILNNWHLIILVAIVIPVLITIVTKTNYPQLFDHIKGRLPFDMSKLDKVIITILAGTFGEEIIFRVFFQQRLNWFIKTPLAVIITSLIFGLVHYSSGNIIIVIFDILSVTIDSLFYGIIFARTKNIYASWFAHFMADFVGLALIMF